MSTSEEFPNDRKPACASPLDKVSAQPSPPGDVLEGSGELVGGFPGPPSLEELLRLRLYSVWGEAGAPDEAIRTMGRLLAQKLEARGLAFAGKSPECILALGTAFFHQLPTILARPRGQWSFDLRACKREYWKIVKDPPPAARELDAKTRDRERRRAKAGARRRIAIPPGAPRRVMAGDPQTGERDGLGEFYVGGPNADSTYDEVSENLEQQNLRALVQNFRKTELAPKEQLAFDRMLNDEPTADNAEACARQRVKKKLRAYLEAQKGTEDMNAAVVNDLADLKLGQRMQGETLDEILRGVEALRARDLEVIDDEDQKSAA